MGRQSIFSLVLAVSMVLAGTSSSQAQQSSPVRRPARPGTAGPRVAEQVSPQPRLVTRPRPGRNPVAIMPKGFPLNPKEQERVDRILDYWEFHTSKIETHECKFRRENYDFVFGSRDTPKSIDIGTIRFKDPDKGLMRVDAVYKVNPNAKDPKQKFIKQDVKFGEYWVCDGKSMYEFDDRTKVLTETKLPPELQGKSIADGPLPFLFGAESKTMKQRYWIREITPKNNPEGNYILEATPKRQADAANFDRMIVRLKAEKNQLFPIAMKLYNKQGYVQYVFKDHSPNNPLHRVQGFLNSFVRPKVPVGWKKVVEDWSIRHGDEQQAAQPSAAKNRR